MVFVRKDSTEQALNYKLLFFKRNLKLREAAGFWDFPGGKVEVQDYQESYQKAFAKLAEKFSQYHDFDKRAACIRECLEETNILISDKQTFQPAISGDFAEWLNQVGVEPAFDKLYAHFRIGPPFGFYPSIDTMFYLCFEDSTHSA